jgi:hypothetical protein
LPPPLSFHHAVARYNDKMSKHTWLLAYSSTASDHPGKTCAALCHSVFGGVWGYGELETGEQMLFTAPDLLIMMQYMMQYRTLGKILGWDQYLPLAMRYDRLGCYRLGRESTLIIQQRPFRSEPRLYPDAPPHTEGHTAWVMSQSLEAGPNAAMPTLSLFL